MRRGTESLLPPCERVRDGGRDGPKACEVHSLRRQIVDIHTGLGQDHPQHPYHRRDRQGGAGCRRRCGGGHQHAQGDGHIPGVRQADNEQQVLRTLRRGGQACRGQGDLRPQVRLGHPPCRRGRYLRLEGCRRIHHGRRERIPDWERGRHQGTGGLPAGERGIVILHGGLRLLHDRIYGWCCP